MGRLHLDLMCSALWLYGGNGGLQFRGFAHLLTSVRLAPRSLPGKAKRANAPVCTREMVLVAPTGGSREVRGVSPFTPVPCALALSCSPDDALLLSLSPHFSPSPSLLVSAGSERFSFRLAQSLIESNGCCAQTAHKQTETQEPL